MRPEDMATRREFLQRGITLVGASATVPLFLQQGAVAIGPADGARTRSRPGVPDERVLIVLQLAGGNDGLNTVIPIGDDLYRKARPRLAVRAADALRLDDTFSLHPALAGLKSLHDDGLLGIVHGVGYPNPNRSHFQSMDIWETASPDGRLYTGWIGRYFDNTCRGEDRPNPESAVALTTQAPLALRGDRFAPVAFQRPENLSWNGGARNRSRQGNSSVEASLFERLNAPEERRAPRSSELAYLQRTAMDARLSARDIQKAAASTPPVTYPGSPLANSLRTVARLIAAGLPTRIYYVSQGGYDTHAGQAGRHQQLLSQFGDAVKAFVADLKATRQLDRVVIMTFSEFGRRVAENASGGTDHGTAAPMFLIGPSVKPGLHGQAPSLEKLDQGDLVFTTDFRSVYAAVLKDWMKTNPATIVGREVTPAPVLRVT